MKANTKKLLAWLYAPSDLGPRFVSKDQARILFPDLTPAGWLSLLTQLEKKGYLVRERTREGEFLRITRLGDVALSQVFPALSSQWEAWAGEWGMVCFLKPPAADPNFRFLRQALLKHGVRAVSRGVYLHPWPFPVSLLELCQRQYGTSVGVVKVSDWTISDFRAIITSVYGIFDLFSLYSGFSREIEDLLTSNGNKKRLKNQSKIHLSLLVDRFLQILANDPGFFTPFLSQDTSGRSILLRLQLLAS